MARYRCPGCGYVYDEEKGDEHEGFKPGTPWRLVPEDWACADCSVRDKVDFVEVDRLQVLSNAMERETSMNIAENSARQN